jgi:hypothetical protein
MYTIRTGYPRFHRFGPFTPPCPPPPAQARRPRSRRRRGRPGRRTPAPPPPRRPPRAAARVPKRPRPGGPSPSRCGRPAPPPSLPRPSSFRAPPASAGYVSGSALSNMDAGRTVPSPPCVDGGPSHTTATGCRLLRDAAPLSARSAERSRAQRPRAHRSARHRFPWAGAPARARIGGRLSGARARSSSSRGLLAGGRRGPCTGIRPLFPSPWPYLHLFDLHWRQVRSLARRAMLQLR